MEKVISMVGRDLTKGRLYQLGAHTVSMVISLDPLRAMILSEASAVGTRPSPD